jgi:hypothetical protein
MEATLTVETSKVTYQITGRHITEGTWKKNILYIKNDQNANFINKNA